MSVNSVADLVQEVIPYVGQDCLLKYRVRTNKDLNADETITGWTLVWVLFADPADLVATLVKTTAAGITIDTPYASVTIDDTDTAALTAGTIYYMQLWRNDSGNKYPLTGFGTFVVQDAPPLV